MGRIVSMEDHPPLPKQVAWFAPWRWKRKWIAGSFAALIIGYPLWIIPAILIAFKLKARGWLPGIVLEMLLCAYKPLEFVGDLTTNGFFLLMRYTTFWQWLIKQTGL